MTAISLDQYITKARSTALQGSGALWGTLLSITQLPKESLKSELWLQQGIAVLFPEDLEKITHTARPLVTGIMAYKMPDGMTWLACADPWSQEALAVLQAQNDGQTVLALSLSPQNTFPKPADSLASTSTNDSGSDVVEFVNRAIAQASDEGASDIHFETHRGGIGIKFRLDGVMVSGAKLASSAAAEQAISRIKVLAELDITERRKPQDGRIRWVGAGQKALDLRVSIMPSVFGEDAVLRLLDKAQLRDSLSQITLEADKATSFL